MRVDFFIVSDVTQFPSDKGTCAIGIAGTITTKDDYYRFTCCIF